MSFNMLKTGVVLLEIGGLTISRKSTERLCEGSSYHRSLMLRESSFISFHLEPFTELNPCESIRPQKNIKRARTKQAKNQTNKQTNKQPTNQASKQASNQASKQASKQTNKETNKQTNKQTTKQPSKQASKQAIKQASKQASKQTNKQRNKPAPSNSRVEKKTKRGVLNGSLYILSILAPLKGIPKTHTP